MPIRIQRKRTKGWVMPENTVSVTRPSDFGNPARVGEWFKIGGTFGGNSSLRHRTVSWTRCFKLEHAGYGFVHVADNSVAVALYKKLIEGGYRPKGIEALRGKNLACWCPLDSPCHADILLQLANKDEP